jgi:hypothetical protein
MRPLAPKRFGSPEASASVGWTYELPPDGAGSQGLEGYGVESAAGVWVGTVRLALQAGTDRYLAVRRLSLLPHDLHLVAWPDVAFVDREARTVRLSLTADQLAGSPRLARGSGVHGDTADLRRIADPPAAESSVSLVRTEPWPHRCVRALRLAARGLLERRPSSRKAGG